MKKSKWTKEEIDYLKKNYNKMRNADLGLHLGRTEMAVAIKLSNLGLYKSGVYLHEIKNTDSGALARKKLFAQWDKEFALPKIEEEEK